MTYQQATAKLPTDAKWSSSFGNPGEGGYTEFWRTQTQRFILSNGRWDDIAPFSWTCEVA